jgi:hypothetical protein
LSEKQLVVPCKQKTVRMDENTFKVIASKFIITVKEWILLGAIEMLSSHPIRLEEISSSTQIVALQTSPFPTQ